MTADSKKRVSSLAKTYEISSDLLVKLLQTAGVDVKSSASMIDQPSFMKVKPLIVAEKERIEREALVKAGKKIPMKAVLKKAPPPPPPAPPKPAPKVEEPAAPALHPSALFKGEIEPEAHREEPARPSVDARQAAEALFRAAPQPEAPQAQEIPRVEE